jgi:hypothetical protein
MSRVDTTAYERVLDALRRHVPSVKANERQATANCPAHNDQHPSLGVTRIEGSVLICCRSQGCHIDDILGAIGLTRADLYDDTKGATYRYDDGRIVHRSPDKKFRQSGNTKGTAQLYRLSCVIDAVKAGKTIYLTEGEKDVHALESLGAVATTSPQGAGNWDKVDPSPLEGARVIVVPDRDDAGKKYAQAVGHTLSGLAASWSIRIPREGKDAADHVAAGLGLDDLLPAAVPAPDEPEGQGDEARTWRPVDLTSVLDGTWQPPRPTVGARDDGVGLFYPGKCHTVASETEGGKTWFALAACLDEITSGNHVVYIDFEDSEGAVVGRLLTMGAGRDAIRAGFHYLRPAEPLGSGINLDDLRRVITDHHPTLGILDGITEGMVMHGLDPLSNRDCADFGRMLPRRIAEAGAAVASLDHVTKDREGRGRYAIGAVHKLNGLDGAAFTLENRSPFGIGITGKSTIRISKDRPGQLRKHALPSSGGLHWFGDLVMGSRGEDFAEVVIEPPHGRDETWRPTRLMAQIADALTKHGPLSQRKVCAAVAGNRQSIIDALNYLILDGYVDEASPHKLLKSYLADEGRND